MKPINHSAVTISQAITSFSGDPAKRILILVLFISSLCAIAFGQERKAYTESAATTDKTAIEALFEKEIVRNGHVTYSWVTRAAVVSHYEVMPLNKMYALLLLTAPRYTVATLSGGGAGLAKEVSRDAVIEGAKILIEHPEAAAREIAYQVFNRGVNAYTDNYKINADFREKRAADPSYKADLSTMRRVAQNTLAIELMGEAKRLIVSINQEEHSNEAGNERISTNERRITAEAMDASEHALSAIMNVSDQVENLEFIKRCAEIMSDSRLPFASYKPLAQFKMRVQNVLSRYEVQFPQSRAWLNELFPGNLVGALGLEKHSAISAPETGEPKSSLPLQKLQIVRATAKHGDVSHIAPFDGNYRGGPNPTYAIDGDRRSLYLSAIAYRLDRDQWWQADLGSVRTINKIRILWHSNYSRKSLELLSSTDGANFTKLPVNVQFSASGNYQEFAVTSSCRFIRLLYVGSQNEAQGFDLNEFEVYGF